MEIGVRELKAKLSEVLDRAAGGEEIVVTDRGTPKARLMPLTGEQRIKALIRAGKITPARSTAPPQKRPPRVEPIRDLDEALAEDRDW